MQLLKITKDNCIQFWDTRWSRSESNFDKKQIEKLCRIAPEFTHNPQLQVVPMTKEEKEHYNADGFAKLLVYKSDYFYDPGGSCICRFCDTFFGYDGNKFGDAEIIEIDIESFGIKKASETRIRKSCALRD